MEFWSQLLVGRDVFANEATASGPHLVMPLAIHVVGVEGLQQLAAHTFGIFYTLAGRRIAGLNGSGGRDGGVRVWGGDSIFPETI